MTNEQLYIAIGIPMAFNLALILALRAEMSAKFKSIEFRFEEINRRFDEMKDLWRAELRRVEEVFHARMDHIEEKFKG